MQTNNKFQMCPNIFSECYSTIDRRFHQRGRMMTTINSLASNENVSLHGVTISGSRNHQNFA